MRKIFSLTAAILLAATMIVPTAAASGDMEVHDSRYYTDSLDSCEQGPSLVSHAVSYGPGQKLVCITFDDGWQNQYDNALPVLQQHGFKATFAMVTTWIGDEGGDCMTYPELHTLADQGMDIASHTRTHAHLPKVDAAKLQNEVAVSKTELENEGFTIRMLVYPYYEYNDTVVTAVKNAGYICARSGALDHPYDPTDTTDPNARYYIDAIEINTQNLNTFKGIVDQATDHSVICLNYHSVSNDAGEPTPRTPVANFGEQMQYLKDNGFTVVLLPDLIEAPSPTIAFSPAGLTFSGTQGGGNPASQSLSITNSGGGTLTWTASSDAAWLTLSPDSGTAPGTVTVSADTTGLSADTYNGTITITSAGATNTPQAVPVTLTVQAPSPTIAFSPAGLTFSGTQGGGNPASQSLTITNSGGGTLTWTASSDAAWLTLSPDSGTAPGTVTVSA
ncbi:MAG: polysaccharide deacetylase family protein, partial [Dehalococcoidia bacterium]